MAGINKGMNIMQVLRMKAQQNPEALNNPRAQELIKIIQSGDKQAGIEAANNILQSYGVSKEEGLRRGIDWLTNNK